MTIRILFTLLISFHGIIHLIGFLNELGLASFEQLSNKVQITLSDHWLKLVAICWGVTALLFLIAALSYMLRKENWWIIAIVAVLISQLLIVLYWQDAKWGTVPNILILLASLVTYWSVNFNKTVAGEVQELFSSVETKGRNLITDKEIKSLPFPVQKWLHRSGVSGKMEPNKVKIYQHGSLRISPKGKWMPFDATQFYTIAKPGFIWKANIHPTPFLAIVGRDQYLDGKGHMLIKFLSQFTVANAKGPEIDQGSLLRFLAEIVWVPGAALQDYISWQPIDSTSAKATMTYGYNTASGIFHFTNEGDIEKFEALRYMEKDGTFILKNWKVTCEGYTNFLGVRIPAESKVSWKLDDGDFEWIQVSIKEVEYID